MVYAEARKRSHDGDPIVSARWAMYECGIESVAFGPLEFGDHKARIVAVQVNGRTSHEPHRIEAGTPIDLNVSVKAFGSIKGACLGLSVRRTEKQAPVFGTNSALLGQRFDLAQDETINAHFHMFADLQPGLYTISLTCHAGLTHIDGCHHWLHEAVQIEIVPGSRLPYHIGLSWLPTRFQLT